MANDSQCWPTRQACCKCFNNARSVVVCVLMLALLAASQLLIHFLLVHLNTLKDVMLQVEKSGDLNARVPLSSRDEVGQMASAFNAMQSGYLVSAPQTPSLNKRG